MKKILIVLFFTPILSFSQGIPRRANTITLKGITKVQLRDSLAKAGFTPVDRDSTFLETLPRQYKQIENGSIILRFSLTDTAIMLTGVFNAIANANVANPYGNKWKPVVHTALYGNSSEAFDIMNAFAIKLPGQITYTRQ